MNDHGRDRSARLDPRAVTDSTRDDAPPTALGADAFHGDRLATLGHIAAKAAHDINGQLVASHHAIHSALHIARELRAQACDPQLLDRLSTVLSDAERASARIGAITANMTLYARSPRDALEAVRLDEVGRDALRVTSGLMAGRAHIVECLRPVPAIEGRVGLLVQLVVNLLVNAVHALDSDKPGTIVIDTRCDGPSVRLAVQDDGPGVPPELRARIFEPYFTTKARGLGTGLGLSIAREIAAEHGGRVDLVSGAEPGARFELVLPLGARPLER